MEGLYILGVQNPTSVMMGKRRRRGEGGRNSSVRWGRVEGRNMLTVWNPPELVIIDD
jgi:hypothetical protein